MEPQVNVTPEPRRNPRRLVVKTSIKAGIVAAPTSACNGSWPVGACQGDATGPSM